MVEEMNFIEERPNIIVYKSLFITDDPVLFHGSCRGKTERINERILALYSQDFDNIILNIKSKKLRSYVKNFISSHLFNLYIRLINNIDVSPRNVFKQLNINIKNIDSPPKDLLQNSLLILIQRDGDNLIVKECDDRYSRLDF
jgi:hypothetical protein